MSRKAGSSAMDMKGYMSLKSSPYCPTGGKLSHQHMYMDQMNSHHKKVLNAKSAIDNRVPKSVTQSQIMRDRKARESVIKTGSRPPSRTTLRNAHGSTDNLTAMSNLSGSRNRLGSDTVMKELRKRQEDADQALVDAIVNDNVNSPRVYCNGEESQGWAKSVTVSRKPPTPRRPPSGDIIDKRGHVFTEPEKPFTPRTLKKGTQSRLSQYKYYKSPPKKPENKIFPSPERPPANTDMNNGSIFDETLMSRDFTRLRQSGTVPPLDISLDTDHLKWMKEQSELAEARQGPNFGKVGDDVKPDTYRWVQTNGFSHRDQNHFQTTQSKLKSDKKEMSGPKSRSMSRSMSNKSMTIQRVDDEEEELKYLEFVKEVTNDVLNRGIFTNRVLKVVFQQHIDKHKGDLQESHMRALLDTLREDLGIPPDDSVVDEHDDGVGMSTSKSYKKKLREYEDRSWKTSSHHNTVHTELKGGDSYTNLDSLVQSELTLEDANKNYKLNKNQIKSTNAGVSVELFERISEKESEKSFSVKSDKAVSIKSVHSRRANNDSIQSDKAMSFKSIHDNFDDVASLKSEKAPSIKSMRSEASVNSHASKASRHKQSRTLKEPLNVENQLADLKLDNVETEVNGQSAKGDSFEVKCGKSYDFGSDDIDNLLTGDNGVKRLSDDDKKYDSEDDVLLSKNNANNNDSADEEVAEITGGRKYSMDSNGDTDLDTTRTENDLNTTRTEDNLHTTREESAIDTDRTETYTARTVGGGDYSDNFSEDDDF